MGRQTDLRTRTGIDKGKDQGSRAVVYRDAKGNEMNATVIGQGSASGLKLAVRNSDKVRIIDNVPLGTSRNATNVYFSAGR